MTDPNLELQESGWKGLRMEARKIEGDLDVKLSSYAKLGARFSQGVGHDIDKLREKMRELTKQIANLYSASKRFPDILEGLRSKNNRTQIECLDLIGFIIDHHGAEISGQLKSLQVVASLRVERDGEIRKAALNTLAMGYKILGCL